MDFSGKRVMIGLSGGINSMAVLCELGNAPIEKRPKSLFLFYAHFKEHSPDTLQFVLDGWTWAKSRFEEVVYKQTDNSVMDFFEDNNFIPHPMHSPCSKELKIIPMMKFAYQNDVQIDLIGYVAEEQKRYKRAQAAGAKTNDLFFRKEYPILNIPNEACFSIVKQNIGWYPAIYDIRDEKGKRVFTHNNCLPCKNMTTKQMQQTKLHYPDYYDRAMEVEQNTGSYFGRSKKPADCRACSF